MASLLLTTRPESVPPVVLMALASNPWGDSEKVNVMVAVWPICKLLVLLLTVTLGARVSALMTGARPEPPPLPAASV